MNFLKKLFVLSFLTPCLLQAQTLPKKILLIPVDDRPATTQYAQMVGDLAGVEVETPPPHLLGKFLQPGSPEGLLTWLETNGINQYDAVIASMDMIAYGGLIASRVNRSSYSLAEERLTRFWRIRKTDHYTPVYAFSAQMRLAPTASADNADWRNYLYYLVVARERVKADPSEKHLQAERAYKKRVPDQVLKEYDLTRQRNIEVQTRLVKMAKHGAFNHLVIGQDDSFPIGPHQPELQHLQNLSAQLEIDYRVKFCSGIDQIACNLVSKVISDYTKWKPNVKIIYSDPIGAEKVAPYESLPIKESLRVQIETSGGKIAQQGIKEDYALFVNTPEPGPRAFDDFIQNLNEGTIAESPIAVADTNLGWSGTADHHLINFLLEDRKALKLLSYAGWNTAGNTMGTTIPAANAYLAGQKFGSDQLHIAIAARRFMLHRLVNDYFFHRYVRPDAYRMIENLQQGKRAEVSQENFDQVNQFVQEDMQDHLQEMFTQYIQGRPFKVGEETYLTTSIKDIKITLPWPRAFEVFIDFELEVQKSVSEPPPFQD